MIALCQLNREGGKEEPQLVHLAQSGAIEQEADSVVLLHHPEQGPSQSRFREAYAIVAKHRHGRIGRIKLAWNPVATEFRNASEPAYVANRHDSFDEYNAAVN